MRALIKFFSIHLTIGVLFISGSCRDTQKREVSASASKLTSNYAVEVEMEGQVFRLQQKNLLPVKKTFTKDSILLLFRENDNPFQLNLNLTNTDVLSKAKVRYTIPDESSGKIKVDLNFFNADRNTKRTNKRIVFRKGTIEIEELTDSKLKMTFEGEGSGMTERGNIFSISGKVNVTLNP